MKKHNKIWMFVPIIIIVALTLFVYWKLSSVPLTKLPQVIMDSNSERTTWIFAIIIIGILIWEVIVAAKKRYEIINDLSGCAQTMRYSKKIGLDNVKNPLLKKCLIDFVKANGQQSNVNLDISDYINESVISDIIHRSITDQIGNAFTALGILGTFVGLTIGLSEFSSNPEELSNSTMVLIGGIKTAYYTSIFGVIASIIYNHFYQEDLEKCSVALEDFLKEYENIVKSTKVDFYSKLLDYNKRQTVAFEGFAETLTPLLKDTVKDILNSTIQKYDKALETYIKETIKSQYNILKDIVSNFMGELTNSLDDEFDNLKDSIESMCKWQNDAVEKLNLVVENIGNVGDNTKELNEVMTNLIFGMRDCFNDGRSAIQSVCDESRYYVDQFAKYSEVVNEYTEDIKDGYKKLTDTVMEHVANGYLEVKDEIIECLNGIQDKTESSFSKLTDGLYVNMATISDEIYEYSGMVKDSTEQNLEYYKDVLHQLEQIDKSIHEFSISTKDIKEDLTKIQDKIEKGTGLTEAAFNTLNNNNNANSEKTSAALEHIDQSIDNGINSVIKTVSEGNIEISSKILSLANSKSGAKR